MAGYVLQVRNAIKKAPALLNQVVTLD